MSDKICIECWVAGRVQGVWFRAGTQNKAKELGVTGCASNLPDGRVKVLACGERAQVEALLVWLHDGPELADVSSVSHHEVAWQDLSRFAIR